MIECPLTSPDRAPVHDDVPVHGTKTMFELPTRNHLQLEDCPNE